MESLYKRIINIRESKTDVENEKYIIDIIAVQTKSEQTQSFLQEE